jgi:protein-disulfide isomerase
MLRTTNGSQSTDVHAKSGAAHKAETCQSPAAGALSDDSEDSVETRRGIFGVPARILVAIAALGWGVTWAGPAAAAEKEPTRADLIKSLEQGPGPSKGSEKAPVVLVEFSDFQCGYCGKFARETLPRIEEAYIRSGKVRFVYRHMALFGEPSIAAAEASLCAFDQGKFWPYHDILFANRSPLAFARASLKQYAAKLGLNEKGFGACLDARKFRDIVETETMLGRRLGASGTPAFLLNGGLAMGAHPFEAFRGAIEALLKPKQPPR